MELYVKPEFFSKFTSEFPLEYTPTFEGNTKDIYTEIKKYIDTNITSKFKEIRYIPFSGGIIDYEEDRWDLSPYTVVKNPHAAFVFKECSPIFKDALKDYLLLIILNGGVKIATLYNELTQLRPFLNYLADSGLYSIDGIDDSDVEKYFSSLVVSERTFVKHQATIKKFLLFYDAEHGTELYTPGIQRLCKRIDHKKLKAIIMANRRKAIPNDYFNKLLSKLITIMNDQNESERTRGMAAMLIIDSQTGLRASELSLLEADSVEEIDIDGEIAKMIKYKVIKSAKGITGYNDEITYINDISYEAYKVAMKVFEDNRKERGVNYLCCPKNAELPMRPEYYINFLKKVCILNHNEFDSTNVKLQATLEGATSKSSYLKAFAKNRQGTYKQIEEFDNDQKFYYPLVHQFRNTVVAGLLSRGIQLEFIRRYMGHLTEEMTSAYAESYDTKMQENLSLSEATLNTILSGEAKLLGANADKLMAGIDKWIESNKLNVATDLDEIIKGLEQLIPIRAKRGGVCMKGSKITNACSVDVQTDEFLCAVGICPNICHFYFNANESYTDYKEIMRIYYYNKENGFKRQADKELTKAHYVLMNRLAPEIRELEKELEKIGYQEVLKRHPDLEDILNNLDDIKEVINEYVEEKLK